MELFAKTVNGFHPLTMKNATVNHLIQANKVLKIVINRKVILTSPQMQNLVECSLATYSDSSYNNLDNENSQGGFIIFLRDKTGRLSPIMLQSQQICQVVKRMMAAEMLALVDAVEALFWLSKLFMEMCSTAEKLVVLPLDCYIDSKQLHEALCSVRPVLDKRSRAEIGKPPEILEKKEINSVKWISSKEQFANYCLTKRGVSFDSLLNVPSPVKED